MVMYGRDGTIHQTTNVNVELDRHGKVVSVWFRCCPLAFTQSVVDDDRAAELHHVYSNGGQRIVAVETTANGADEELNPIARRLRDALGSLWED